MEKSLPISIVMPVYNAEKTLPKCLDSILAQTMEGFELICVDDGSEDGSLLVLEDYASRDSRVRIISKENDGATSARKIGVEEARGEYIGFVDADDWIEANMYEKLYGVASETEVDLVASGYVQEGNYVSISYDNVEPGLYSNEEMEIIRDNFFFNLPMKDKGLIAALWSKLIKAEIIKAAIKNIPNDLTMGDDKMTLLACILECQSVIVLRDAFYHYIMHPSSLTHDADERYLLRIDCMYQYMRSLYSHENFTENMRRQAELYITQYLIKGINIYLNFSIHNLLWIDPYWLDKIPAGAHVVLYGGGTLCTKYIQQLKSIDKHVFVGCVDFGYERFIGSSFKVEPPEMLIDKEYDCVVITIKDPKSASDVRVQLEEVGIPKEKIFWFRQDEIFWRYAKAEGLLAE